LLALNSINDLYFLQVNEEYTLQFLPKKKVFLDRKRKQNIQILFVINVILYATKQTRTVMDIMTDSAYRTRTHTRIILFIDVKVLVVIRKNATDRASSFYENRHCGVTPYIIRPVQCDTMTSHRWQIHDRGEDHDIILYYVIIIYTFTVGIIVL